MGRFACSCEIFLRRDVRHRPECSILFATEDGREEIVPARWLRATAGGEIAPIGAFAINQSEVGEHVSRGSALEKRRATYCAIRNAITRKGNFQRCEVMVGARENKNIAIGEACLLFSPCA